jgi:uncharacterized protein YfdQ (DUF2303 family)
VTNPAPGVPTALPQPENIAATLVRELPRPQVVLAQTSEDEDNAITHIALPKGMTLQAIDNEPLLRNPRRAKGAAVFADLDSFARYVLDHKTDSTVVWCTFDPKTFALSFTGVIDDHAPGTAGWRHHRAVFRPAMAAEWNTWTKMNRESQAQVAFAEFLEANENDVLAAEGMPTSLQMHALATEFVARQDVAIKSVVRLQSGGVQLNYINDADSGTTEAMRVFERFAIAIPVFWTAPEGGDAAAPVKAYRIDARLKYRFANGKVAFHYELIRPDHVHQKAAVEVLEQMRVRLVEVPLLMGEFRDA